LKRGGEGNGPAKGDLAPVGKSIKPRTKKMATIKSSRKLENTPGPEENFLDKTEGKKPGVGCPLKGWCSCIKIRTRPGVS